MRRRPYWLGSARCEAGLRMTVASPSAGAGRRPPRLFYGWVVVAIAFVTMGVAISARTAFSLLYPEILDEFGWSRGETALAFSLGFWLSTLMMPVVGWAMERFGPRVAVPVGALMVAGGYLMLTNVETRLELYVAMGVLIVNGSMAMSYIVHSMFLPAWFVRNRGLATGVAFAGVGVGSIALLPALQWAIDAYGWRTASVAVAAIVFFAIAPLNALFQRASPEPMGLEPDGGPSRAARDGAPAPDVVVDRDWAERDWTLGAAVRTARFWSFSISFFCTLFVFYAWQAHQTTFLREIGYSADFAAAMLGLVAFFGVFGQILIGMLSDECGREIAWSVAQLGHVLTGVSFIVIAHTAADGTLAVEWVYAMVAAQGLLASGVASVFGAVIAEMFSGSGFFKIFAVISLCGNLGAGTGAWALGALYDVNGRYLEGFVLCIAMAAISTILIWVASPGRVRLVAGQARRRAQETPRAGLSG